MPACAIVKKPWRTTAMNLMNQRVRLNLVGRTPWSAADALVGLYAPEQEARGAA